MAPKHSKEELKTREADLQASINRRIDALQDEVVTLGDAVKSSVFNHPLLSVGGALLAGLIVGLLFGGRRKRREPLRMKARRTVLDQYVNALIEEARYRVAKGDEAGEAVRAALQDRIPLIVYEAPEERDKQSLLGQVVDMGVKAALGMGAKFGTDYLLRRLNFEEPEARAAKPEKDDVRTAFATAAVSEAMED